MNLPADKAKVLKQYDDEKKWDLICDQVRDILCNDIVKIIILFLLFFVNYVMFFY